MNWVEWAIVAFIVVGIGYVVWRGGAANPVGTGALEHNVRGIRQEVQALERIAKGAAKADDLARLEREFGEERAKVDRVLKGLATIEGNQGSRAEALNRFGDELRQLGAQVDALQKECAGRLSGVETTAKATSRSVYRIEQMLIEDGLRGRKP